MLEGLEGKITKTKDVIGLVRWRVFGKPMNFYLLEKNADGEYIYERKVVEAVPIEGVRDDVNLELNDRETEREIRMAMTRFKLTKDGSDANAFYIRKMNGSKKIYPGGNKAQYQPLRILGYK